MAYTGTNFSAPKLDGEALRRYTSKNIMENIFQDVLALPEKGVTERYSEDTDASEIRIIRQVTPNISSRRMGANKNGGYFNSNTPLMPQSVEYGIKILYMIDEQIDFPTVMDEMVELPVAEATTKAVAGVVAKHINASTIAHQLAKVINQEIVVEGSTNNVVLSAAGAYKEALIDANGKLDDGDIDNGIDIFPINGRQIFARSATRTGLFKNGNIFVGGSNYAQEMLARGAISPNTYKQDKLQYVGEIDSVPMCVVSKPVWDLAEQYLGIDEGKLDTVDALVCAGIATGRALAFNNSVKIIDCPRGQGKTAQYKYRWGIEVFSYKGIVPVLANGTTLATISATPLTIEAPESVQKTPLLAPVLADNAGSNKFTWSAVNNAGSYNVYKDSQLVKVVKTTDTLEYTYGAGASGSFTVQAMSKNIKFESSALSNAIVK